MRKDNKITDKEYWDKYWNNYRYDKITDMVVFEVVFEKYMSALSKGNSFIEIGGFAIYAEI